MSGARSRLDRAILNLKALEGMLSGEELDRLRVFVSRTSCTLNTIATELTAYVDSTSPPNDDVITRAADILWSFGELAALADCEFGSLEDARPEN